MNQKSYEEHPKQQDQGETQEVFLQQKPIWATAVSFEQSHIVNPSKQSNLKNVNESSVFKNQEKEEQYYQTELFKKTGGDYTEEYEKMKDLVQLNEEISQQEIQKILAELMLNKIKILNQNIGDQFLVQQVIRHSNRVFEIRIRMGIFSVQISVFSLHQIDYKYDSRKKNDPQNKIKQKRYLFEDDIVCQKFQNFITAGSSQGNIKQTKPWFLMVLKEFAFTKIFSVLKIGPKICTPFGFDIIRYKNGFAFDIEKCYPIQIGLPNKTKQMSKFEFKKVVYKKDINDLKKGLTIMHGLKILHLDIKIANIMYSFSWQKCVFIDYGIASCVKQTTKQSTKIKGWMGPNLILGSQQYSQMNELSKIGRNVLANLNFYINDLRLFANFLSQCYFQLNSKQDPYQNNIQNYFDPYKNAFLQIMQDKKIKGTSIVIESEKDLLWVRFFYNFYIGDYQKMKNEIQFLVNHSQKNYSNNDTINKLNEALIKTEQQVTKSFQFSDFNPHIYEFIEWVNQLKVQHKELYDLNKGNFMMQLMFNNEQLVQNLFFSVKKNLIKQRDLLIQDLVTSFISLVHFKQKTDDSVRKPNFYQVQYQFLQQCSENQVKTIINKQNIQKEVSQQFDMKRLIEKYVFFISYRRRIGTSTLENRKKIAVYFNKKMKSFLHYYFEQELHSTRLYESYVIAQQFFREYLKSQYINFEPFLDSYWIILVWIFRQKKFQLIKNGNKQTKLFAIQTGTQIFYNFALCGYYNQKLHVLIGQWIVELFEQRESNIREDFSWIQKLNLLLKLREVRQIAVYTTQFHFLLIHQNVQIFESSQQNLNINKQRLQQSGSKREFKSFNEFELQFLKSYKPKNNSSKIQQEAITLYQQLIQSLWHDYPVQKFKTMAQKSRKLLYQNPQQMLQLYKITTVSYFIRNRLHKPGQYYPIINNCKLYSVYQKQTPIPQNILNSLNLTQSQKKKLKQQYKDSYFQPQMFVVLAFLKFMTQTNPTIQGLLYQKIDNIIWYHELSKFIFLIPKIKKNIIQKVKYFIQTQVKNTEVQKQIKMVLKPLNQFVDFSLIQKLRIHKELMKARNKFYQPSDVDFLVRTLQFVTEYQNYPQSLEDRNQLSFLIQSLEKQIIQIIKYFFQLKMKKINPEQLTALQALIDFLTFSNIILKSRCFKFTFKTVSQGKTEEEKTSEIQTSKESLAKFQNCMKQQVFECLLRQIKLKAKEVNRFLRDQSKNLDQVEHGQLIFILLTVAQIRISIHIQKFNDNLPKLMKKHQYITLKLKELPQLLSTVTQTMKNLNLNVVLFYLIDTFIRCIDTQGDLINKQLKKIQIQRKKQQKIISQNSQKSSSQQLQTSQFKKYSGQDLNQDKHFLNDVPISNEKSKRQTNQRSYQKFQQQIQVRQDENSQRQKQLKEMLKKLKQELTEDNSWLNSTLLMLHKGFKKEPQRQILFAQYIETTIQMCQIFTRAINEIHFSKKQDISILSRWYKNIKPSQKYEQKNDPFISARQQRIRKEEIKIFELMWRFILIVTRKYFIHYSEMYLRDLFWFYQLAFRRLGFLPLLHFIEFIYEQLEICFETKPQNLLQKVNVNTSLRTNKNPKFSQRLLSSELRYLPMILSYANKQLMNMLDQQQNEKNKDYCHLAELFKRNSLAVNFMFLRNSCLKKLKTQDRPEQPIYFSRKIQKQALISCQLTKYHQKDTQYRYQQSQSQKNMVNQGNQISTVASLQELKYRQEILNNQSEQILVFSHKKNLLNFYQSLKALTKQEIILQILKLVRQEACFQKMREHCGFVITNMRSHIQNLIVQQHDESNHNNYLTRIYNLAIDTSAYLLLDRHIILKVEFIHFYTLMGKDYSTFNYFFQLAGKINRNQLFCKLLQQKKSIGNQLNKKSKWIDEYRKNKRRSNLFHPSRISQLVEIQKIAKFQSKYSKQNQNNSINPLSYQNKFIETLKRKSHLHKTAYARLLLFRLGILK